MVANIIGCVLLGLFILTGLAMILWVALIIIGNKKP